MGIKKNTSRKYFMITESSFKEINEQVNSAINQAFDIAMKRTPSDYILLLADAEYKAINLTYSPLLNPYVIDSQEDKWVDETRVQYLVEFLKTFYSFPKGMEQVENSEIRQQMELMIYTHVWESKPFLKRLYRLARLTASNSYDWKVIVPQKRYNFISNKIRTLFENEKLQLGEIIRQGYHSSLRNAFAHSEYSFDVKNGLIWLNNYGGADWELKNISFDNWSTRFAYSVLIAYHLLDISNHRILSLSIDFQKNVLHISHPSSTGKVSLTNIFYEPEYNHFGFAI